MSDHTEKSDKNVPLRRGWTTGACSTAATKAALTALVTGEFPDPVTITLPKGQTPAFALAFERLEDQHAEAGIIKDAGDDPDVTHGALIKVKVAFGQPESGVRFIAGEGVGMVTRPGLPIPVGEPAINPMPRQMMQTVVQELSRSYGFSPDVDITISVRNGEKLAQKTWNPRLGIMGGLSILGTTGIVIPFSCSAWIHSIHRGIDVARAGGHDHVAGCTGSTSEKRVKDLYGLQDFSMLDMGDFVGGMLKYLRKNPVPRVTIGGGFAKLSKLAQGHMDLHSGRSQVDFDWMAEQLFELGADSGLLARARQANSALALLEDAQRECVDIAGAIASKAQQQALLMLRQAPIKVDVVVVGRDGKLLARTQPLNAEDQ
ncbi:cobalt-precorrin-5B (C(1))-methyltransferase [Cohaesibacter celericrescens]|uniref:Cobalt-precorrin-5B C(1)-methyltransferase n=1 Tax=Cohaesibacter celericrescens TaxID=2067669 RepID=A0A2N5XW27_9HYPH|nr:cobalt-precorrin-5B (C(1))-methyltransferase [Cohaesibacter celericrescens]PLW78635.1 cobalt-precorrin-5B (C(1))-methyltransferase [Cohaesibacter celericrescens]